MTHSKVGFLAWTVLLIGLTSCGGSDSVTEPPPPPRATSITLTQSSVTLSFLGATVTVTASILDQNGRSFGGAVSFSSDDPAVATVNTGGRITAIANGTTTVRATSGTLTATVSVTVQQVATRISVLSGDAQTGTVGQALLSPVVVRGEDAGGAPVSAVAITFVPSEGSGSVGESTTTSDEQGEATTTWTLGTEAGDQQLTVAIAGSSAASAQLSATAQPGEPTAPTKASGDQQAGTTGMPLAEPVVVRLTDEFGNGVPGVLVTFTITEGGGEVATAEGTTGSAQAIAGSAGTAQATTGSAGTAQATWTMGPDPGANGLSATAPNLPAVAFTATAEIHVPQADLTLGPLIVTPANPTSLQTLEVSTTVTNSGDLTTGTGFAVQLLIDGTVVANTDLGVLAAGIASNVSFTVGPLTGGAHVFRVIVDPSDAVSESDEDNNSVLRTTAVAVATELVPDTPISDVSGAAGSEQLFLMELPESSTGTMVVKLSGGPGDVDLYVHRGDRPSSRDDYECLSGGPTTSEACVFNNAEPGTYHVLLFAFTTFSGTTLEATTGGPVVPFDIELVFIDHGTATQDAAIVAAAERWMSIITTDIADITFAPQPVPANACIEGQPLVNDVVDDVRIYIKITEIDGPFGTLARAGPCFTRGLSNLPVLGTMEFDSEDLTRLEDGGDLATVILHEMGHVLGIGTVWPLFDLLLNPSLPSDAGADTHFAGPLAIEAFDDAGGTTYTGGAKVPVANGADEGSADGHWRESVLAEELMTPLLDPGFLNPLSAISVRSLADLGYRIDVSNADPFSKVFTSPARGPGQRSVIDLRGDIRQGPRFVIDAKGRITRVTQR